MNAVVALQATATPPVAAAEIVDTMLNFIPLMIMLLVFVALASILKGNTSQSRSPGESQPVLRPALAWGYRHSIGAVVERKRHGWRTFGTVAYRAATPATVDFCLHCEDGGEGFEIAFGRQWILFGFVVRHAREGVVRVCQSCEVENQQTVDAVRMDGPGRWRDAGADAPGRSDR